MNTLKQAVRPSGVVLALLAAITLLWKFDTTPSALTNMVFVLVIAVATMVVTQLSSGKFNRIPAFMLAIQSIGYAIVANIATDGRYWLSVAWIVLGAIVAIWVFIQTKDAPKTKLKIARTFAVVAVSGVFLTGSLAAVVVNVSGGSSTQVVETNSLPLYNDGNPLVIPEVDLASIDQPLVGNGVNVAAPPVLSDNKGLVTSWANFVERVNALPEAGRQNTIANTNGWNNVTKARYPDRADLQFPSWDEIQHLATIPGEFRVIAKVNNNKSDQEAREAVRPLIGNLADTLPVVKVDGALINTMCGGGDCSNSFSPAQQFVDGNGQFRIVLSKPIASKNGYIVNVEAVKLGVGLGTECGNGFIGTTVFSPEAVKIVYGGTGNGDYTPPPPHTTTEVTPPPPSSETPPPPTTTTTVPPTTTTTVPPTTTTTVPPTTTTTVPPTTTTTVPPTTTTTVPPTTTTLTPKDENQDPENQGNNQPGHGGQNDAPAPTASAPAGGTPPATYTAPAVPEPTTETRPEPIPTENQGAPVDQPAPAEPAPGNEPCNPAICNEQGVDHAADAAAQAAAAAAEVASAPIAPVAPAATEAEAPAPAPAVVEAPPAAAVSVPTVESQPTVDTAGADIGDASDPASVPVAEVGLTSSATTEIPTFAYVALAGIIAIMLVGAAIANRKPEEATETVITME